jgi:putative ATP-binding cassette transporter
VRQGSMKDTSKRQIVRDAWRLSRPYWTSEEKLSAWGILLAVIALNLGNVCISMRINAWNNAFYHALQAFDSGELLRQLGTFCILVTFAVAMSVYSLFLTQMLQIRWRRWLTRRYLDAWLADYAYSSCSSGARTTILTSVSLRTSTNLLPTWLSLSLGLLTSVVSLISFLVILWGLSGSAEIPLGKWGTVHIPAYLVWTALTYAGVGTWLAVKIGRPLVPLNVARQRFEADFRFSLVRFREHAESVALYGDEPAELRVFSERLHRVFENFRHIMKRQRRLTCFTLGYTQVALIFPLAVVSPRYFAKQIGWGGLMQVVSAFSFVQNSLSFIINAYTDIAAWQAVTQRLSGFEQQLLAIHQSKRAPRQINIRRRDIGVAVEEIDLDLPDGTPLLRDVEFASARGEALLIEGSTGAGKSTLLRAICRNLAVRPRRNQARQRANALRPAKALSAARHSCQRAALPTWR